MAYAQNPNYAYGGFDGDTYFGVEYGALNSDAANLDDWDTGVLFGRFGMVILQQGLVGVAAEGFLGLGIVDEDWASGCDAETVSTDSIIGAQLKAFADLGGAKIHAVIGANMVSASITIKGTCPGYTWSESYDDSEIALTYGFGGELKINENAAISANLQVFYDADYSGVDLTISGLLVGYKHSF